MANNNNGNVNGRNGWDEEEEKRFSIFNPRSIRRDFDFIFSKSENLKNLAGNSELLKDLLSDLYGLLLQGDPRFKEVKQLLTSRLINLAVLQECFRTQEYRELHESTIGDNVSAALGVLGLGPYLVETVSEFDNASKLAEIEEKLENLKELIKTIKNRPGAKSQIEKYEKEIKKLEREKKKYEKLLGEDIERERDNIRIEIREQIEEMSDWDEVVASSISWGSSPGSLVKLDISKSIEFAQLLINNEKLRDIARLAGKLKSIGFEKRRQRGKKRAHEVESIERGSDHGRILPSQLSMLKDQRLKNVFRKGLLERSLLQYEIIGTDDQASGPMIICIDESGSMSGQREIFAKAYALALQGIAAKEKRDYHYISFGTEIGQSKFLSKGICPPYEMAEMMTTFLGHGGTNFDKPLSEAMDTIKNGLPKADIIFISDGECEASTELASKLRRFKSERGTSVYLILTLSGYNGLGDLADYVVNAEPDNYKDSLDIFERLS